MNDVTPLPKEVNDRSAPTDELMGSSARSQSKVASKRLRDEGHAHDADDTRDERIRVLAEDSHVEVWSQPTTGVEALVVGGLGSDELARSGWTRVVTCNAVFIGDSDELARKGWTCAATFRELESPRELRAEPERAGDEAVMSDAGEPDDVGTLLPSYAAATIDGVSLMKHEALVRAVETGFEVRGAHFAPLREWTVHRRKRAWRREALGRLRVKRLQTLFSDLLGVYWALTHPEQLSDGVTVLSGFKKLKAEGGRLLKTVRGERFDLVARLAGERVELRKRQGPFPRVRLIVRGNRLIMRECAA